MFHHLGFAADHHAIAPLQAPDAAAGSDIHVMDALGCEFFGSPDVIHVIRVAAINEYVAWLQQQRELSNGFVHDGRRHHQPERPRLGEFLDEIGQRRGTSRFLLNQLCDHFRGHVEDDAFMSCFEKAPHHIGAHSPKSNHSKLHYRVPFFRAACSFR